MPYRLVSKGRASGDDLIVVYAIILGVFFFFCVLPMIEKKHLKEVEKMTNTKNALKIIMHDKIDTNKCSKQCCKHTQWPLPKEIQHTGDLTPEQMKNLVPSNLTCNHGNGGGCVCLEKKQFDTLAKRGNNK